MEGAISRPCVVPPRSHRQDELLVTNLSLRIKPNPSGVALTRISPCCLQDAVYVGIRKVWSFEQSTAEKR